MKRTKNINHSSFRKSWSARHLTPVALAVTAVFMLAGCEKSDETVSLYQNADDCSAANPGKAAECTTAYTNAVKEAERTAPKYATREDCVAEFGEGQCQQTPAQAGVAPENQAQAQSSGSFWMPLMAGYMMGRLMGGGMAQQQPLFSSKNAGSHQNPRENRGENPFFENQLRKLCFFHHVQPKRLCAHVSQR